MTSFEPAFIVKLTLAFFCGGAYIAFASWIFERFGSKIGGVVTGLPSTLLISFIFLAWTQSPQAAISSLPIVPAAIAANAPFLAAFILLYRFWKKWAVIGSFTIWFLLTLPLVLLHLDSIGSPPFLLRSCSPSPFSSFGKLPTKNYLTIPLACQNFYLESPLPVRLLLYRCFLGRCSARSGAECLQAFRLHSLLHFSFWRGSMESILRPRWQRRCLMAAWAMCCSR